MKHILIAITALLLLGCSTQTIIEVPKEVKVPVKCQVKKTTPPTDTGNVVQNAINISIYAEILHSDLEFCTKEIKAGDIK